MHDVIFNPVDPLPKVWDPNARIGDMLRGKRGLVVGMANEHSIAFGCAAKLRAFGAELAIIYANEKSEQYVRPLGEHIQSSFMMPLDVEKPGELEAVFDRIKSEWGRLDFLIHSIAFAPKDDLHGRVVDCSLPGFEKSDADILLLVYSHGAPRRAVDDERRSAVDHELLRRRQSR